MSQPAIVNFSPEAGSVELREVPDPEMVSGEILLKVGAVGVCGSDLHQWQSTHSWPVNYPVILGHEFGGEIVEIADDVEGWSPGDMVVSETAAIINGENPMTRRGLYNLDPDRKGFGYGVDGAMAELVRVPVRCLHRIPNGLEMEHAALTEPCCVAYNAMVNNTRIDPGDRVLVIGPGTIGILCAVIARLRGGDVCLLGRTEDATRLQVASKGYGIEVLSSNAEQWAREGDGLGVDVVVDAAGVSRTLEMAIELVRPAGWVTKVGWGPQPLGFSIDAMVQKNVTLQGSFSHNWPVWERVLQLLGTGAIDVAPLIGGKWDLGDWRVAFDAMHSGKVVKSVLVPSG
ncbi:MAG: alcohol dehydrogenase catalytic domain-containing protein [Verrucomicrobiaceae bacterium]|nr:alcohol dehydrogenase catalytic domain-containing protein [Verrucomicrobiaceae bacterium]